MRYGVIGSNGSVVFKTYGEGNDALQDPLLKGVWYPQMKDVWNENANEIENTLDGQE